MRRVLKATKLNIPDVILIEPQIFNDERGFFFESFNHQKFEKITGVKTNFVQDNHSLSQRGVIRGLHYQISPKAQGKLVRAISGQAFDVAVDIRKNSPTFGKWVAEILSQDNKKQLWIPPGFAHGFLAMEDNTEILYKTTDFYSQEHESSIIWNDPDINISWPDVGDIHISTKDKNASTLKMLQDAS